MMRYSARNATDLVCSHPVTGRRVCALACLTLFILLCCAPARAAAPKYFSLGEPLLSVEDGGVTLSLSIGVDSTEGLRDMLRDGAIMELAVKTAIVRPRTLLPNVAIRESVFTSLLRYNPLTREFSLTMPGADQAILDKNLGRLLEATWKKFTVFLGEPAMFQGEEPGSAYRLVLDFSLRHTEVPPWLAKAFIFWSWDVVEPERLTLSFTR